MSSSLQVNHPGTSLSAGSVYQSLPVDTKAHTFVAPKFKEAAKPNFLQSIIQRGRRKLNETALQLTVHGIYSLPDAWKSKIVRNLTF